MRVDSQWAFVNYGGAALSLVGALGTNIASATIDLLGQGVGTKPANIFGTQSALFGADLGQNSGLLIPKLVGIIGTAATTATAATLNAAFQAAADLGAAGNYQPDTWNTLEETGAIAVGKLTANTKFMALDWPPRFPDNLRPRFIRVLLQIPAATAFTAGTISFLAVVPDQDALASRQAQRNYSVS